MEKYKVIALFGQSGAGKDTIQNWIVSKYGFNKVVSFTSRPKRDYEIEGIDYYFKEYGDLPKREEIIESSVFRGWVYGTTYDGLDKGNINVGVFNIQGVISLLRNSKIDVLPIYIYADDKVRIERCLNREKHPDVKEICRRFISDTADFEDAGVDYEGQGKLVKFKPVFEFLTFDNTPENENDYYGIMNIGGVKEFIDKKD